MSKFRKWKSTVNGQYYFHLRSSNGEVILSSEGYLTEYGCDNGINSVKRNAPFDSQYQRKDGITYTFNLKGANGEIIGKSESYTTRLGREVGINAVKRSAPTAIVEFLNTSNYGT